MDKIKFKDLSGWLKAIMIVMIIAIVYLFYFQSLLVNWLESMTDWVDAMTDLVEVYHNGRN